MKTIFTTEFKVGITLIISTLILIFGIIWGKEFRLRTNKYQLEIAFENVGGMVPGDPVTVNGLKEGKVLDIGWHDRMVLCRVEISDDVQLYEDATFTVISAELLAGMKIEIFPGKSNQHINLSRQPFMGKYGGRIVDVGLVIGELAEDMSTLSFRIDTTVTILNDLLKTGQLQKDLQGSLANLNAITAQLTDLPVVLNRTMTDFDGTIASLNNMIKNNDGELGSAIKNLNTVSARFDTVSVSLQSVISKIDRQEGTLGMMVHDSSLYLNLSRTLLSIDSLANKINQDGFDIDLF